MQDLRAAELVRRRQIQAVAAAFLRRRPLIVGPPVALLLLVFAVTGVPKTQLLALAAVKLSMVGFFSWESLRYRRQPIGDRAFFASLAVTVLGIATAAALSGGMRSPFVPLLFAPTLLGLAAFGQRPPGRALVGMLVAVGLGLLVVPRAMPWPPLPAAAAAGATLGVVLVTTGLLAVGIAGLVDAYERTGFALGEMRAEAAAEAEARSRELGTLGARLAHEIRNPLAALKGLLQLEARHAQGERAQRRFAVMEGEVARLETILSEYLDFTRVPGPPALAPCEVRGLLRDVLALLEGRAQAAGVRLLEEGDDLTCQVDARLMKQAVFNLLANALEATPAGGEVRARVRRTSEGVAIDLADNGRGMDAQVLARLGTPFFTTRSQGTGLGVVIARRIARQHGGDLRFESWSGVGTVATLLLPLAAKDKP